MKILVLPGDGIGPEIVAASVNVLKAADTKFKLGLSFDYDDVGFTSLEKYGTTLREEVLTRAKTYDGVILGTQSHAWRVILRIDNAMSGLGRCRLHQLGEVRHPGRFDDGQ